MVSDFIIIACMSGHSKWATIKRQKAVTDARRGAAFTKLSKNIAVAARQGKDPNMNPSLRVAIEKARAVSMPKDNIEKAILKGAGELPGLVYEEVVYEGYGPGGAALVIACVTDNTNRTVSTVRSVLTKHGGSLGSAGNVMFLFDHSGVIRIAADQLGGRSLDDVELVAIDAGARDIQRAEEGLTVYTAREHLSAVERVLREQQIPLMSVGLEYVPKTYLPLAPEQQQQLQQLVDALDEDDDVNEVFTNVDV